MMRKQIEVPMTAVDWRSRLIIRQARAGVVEGAMVLAKIAKPTESGEFALLANLYNAKTIDIVLDSYPVKSIKDISLGGGLLASIAGGPWKANVTRLGG